MWCFGALVYCRGHSVGSRAGRGRQQHKRQRRGCGGSGGASVRACANSTTALPIGDPAPAAGRRPTPVGPAALPHSARFGGHTCTRMRSVSHCSSGSGATMHGCATSRKMYLRSVVQRGCVPGWPAGEAAVQRARQLRRPARHAAAAASMHRAFAIKQAQTPQASPDKPRTAQSLCSAARTQPPRNRSTARMRCCSTGGAHEGGWRDSTSGGRSLRHASARACAPCMQARRARRRLSRGGGLAVGRGGGTACRSTAGRAPAVSHLVKVADQHFCIRLQAALPPQDGILDDGSRGSTRGIPMTACGQRWGAMPARTRGLPARHALPGSHASSRARATEWTQGMPSLLQTLPTNSACCSEPAARIGRTIRPRRGSARAPAPPAPGNEAAPAKQRGWQGGVPMKHSAARRSTGCSHRDIMCAPTAAASPIGPRHTGPTRLWEGHRRRRRLGGGGSLRVLLHLPFLVQLPARPQRHVPPQRAPADGQLHRRQRAAGRRGPVAALPLQGWEARCGAVDSMHCRGQGGLLAE